MAGSPLAPLQEFPPDQLRVVDDLVEIVVIAQRLLHSLRVGSDLAAVQRVDRVLAVVEPGEDRRELVGGAAVRSEEHTSELQSQSNLVCRLLLEKKKKTNVR